MDTAIIKDIAIVVGGPVIRSVAGWARVALKDNKVTNFEIKQLLETIVRVGTIGVFAYFGLEATGVDQAAIIATASAFFADKVFSAIEKGKTVKKSKK
jgi:hypothetical protein